MRRQRYNPDLALISDSIAHQAEKCVMEVIPNTQQRPIGIKINIVIRSRNAPFQRPQNLKKADWLNYANDIDKNITPTPEYYAKFVNLVRRASHENLPRGSCSSYVCGRNYQTKEMSEDYQRCFTEDSFSDNIVKLGDAQFNEISESQRSKWQDVIEFTDFTYSSHKAWKTSLRKTTLHVISNVESLQTRWLTNYYSMVKETRITSHREEKDQTRCDRIHADITIPNGGYAERYQILEEKERSMPRSHALRTNQEL